ncbi:ribokinase [Falsirhodobacter xinxiangensis]|uniref:ribokinase n=1 Tax=Falsirhodobacter xinxiangensis TaxID=2530049 RepID=UPI0010AB409D|nr:ribokinase [Rhodobacter xinxiangensis]
MAIWNFGSINLDHVYRVPHLVNPGETLQASDYKVGLGGKGANQSVAAARAGARCLHLGAVGHDGAWAREVLAAAGVDVRHIAVTDTPTGHAIINVDPGAENSIVIFPGANRVLAAPDLAGAAAGDLLLLQNETSAQAEAAAAGAARGMRVIYSAAPFDPEAVRAVLPHVSLLVMNAVEARSLRAAMGEVPPVEMIVTSGAEGAEWIGQHPLHVPAFGVDPVDTTGAGDCFAGTLAAALDMGEGAEGAMLRASAAAALQVTRHGAADAMPTAAEVETFLAQMT